MRPQHHPHSKNSSEAAGDRIRCKTDLPAIRYDVGYRPVRYYLKRYYPDTEKSQIVMAVSVQGIRYRVCTKMKVEPAFWDRNEQKCLDSELLCTRVRKRVRGINENLSMIAIETERKDRILAERGEYLTLSHIRDIVASVVKPASGRKDDTPLEILRKLTGDYTTQLNSRGRKGTSSSAQTYLMAISRLEKFLNDTGFVLRNFSCFNKTFFDRFREYLMHCKFQKGGKEFEYTSNTVVNTISVINNLTRKAYELNLGGETYYRGTCFIPREPAVKIYLTERELDRLKRVKTFSSSEEQIRDMFIIASYTALRISDINRLNSASFGNGAISLQQKKTKNCVCVPILKEIADMTDKYIREGFPVINCSVANACIKELARRAGIDEVIMVPETRGGDRTVRLMPKYSQVCFHTARRSCITNLYKRGYSINHLMSLSGHKSIASFQRYIKSDAGEMSQEFIKELRKRKDI